MATRSDITPELCRQLLRYEPETGKLYWQWRPREMFESDRIFASWNTKWAGKRAFDTYAESGRSGCASYKGSILNLRFKAHRVAWAIHYGAWPDEIDHINGDPLDNRIANLRSVTRQENCRNTSIPAHNKSGHMGVTWDKRTSKWLVKIRTGNRVKHIGLFASVDDAAVAREEANRKYGYHQNHGRD